MEKQFNDVTTFFDLNMDADDDVFATLNCVMGGASKKRANRNRLVVSYLKGKELTEEEIIIAQNTLDGTIYSDDEKRFEHCQLCSEKFVKEDLPNISSQFENWELCFPTHPYTPGGMMIF